jgi:3-methyladenine DNA glycosylase Tag
MARSVEAYRDERGHVHDTPAEAIIADIAASLGRVGDEGGLTNGVAALILEKRAAIEKAFADYDRLVVQRPLMVENTDEATVHRLKA